ncbi:MAG: hypothetical protein HUU29_06945 [Planctomycetaceae bacterium]|nr:hypothetical protein [Planctomycetaceae bacterium]
MELLAKNPEATALRLLPPPAVKLARKAGRSRITAKIRNLIKFPLLTPSIVEDEYHLAALETRRLAEDLVARGYGPYEVADLLKTHGRHARPINETLGIERHLARLS